MMGLKLIHVSKRGHWYARRKYFDSYINPRTAHFVTLTYFNDVDKMNDIKTSMCWYHNLRECWRGSCAMLSIVDLLVDEAIRFINIKKDFIDCTKKERFSLPISSEVQSIHMWFCGTCDFPITSSRLQKPLNTLISYLVYILYYK